jgi:hypothetical protein
MDEAYDHAPTQDPSRLPQVPRRESSETPFAAQANGVAHWKADLRSKDSRAAWMGTGGKGAARPPRQQPTLQLAAFSGGGAGAVLPSCPAAVP